MEAHRKRCLSEASAAYTRLLERDRPADPTAEQRALIFKFAPRLYLVDGEFFPLKDIVAILHPDRPVIGYHLFWEDDIAYPADNDPCDHEIVWIEYDPATLKVVRVSTYFHGRVLSPAGAVDEANAHDGQAWIGVEWGFHGSVPWGATELVAETFKKHWELAHIKARDLPRSPLARGWPSSYPGDLAAYSTFSIPHDPAPALRQPGLIYVSRWPMAVLNRYCLRYNFATKTEWPWLAVEKP